MTKNELIIKRQEHHKIRLFVTTILRSVIKSHNYSVPHHALEDLVQQGLINYYEALGKYDKSQGVPLENFAYIRISGGFIDHFRKNSPIPRRQQKIYRDYIDLKERDCSEGVLSETEIASKLGIDVIKLREYLLTWEARNSVSLDNQFDSNDLASEWSNPEKLLLDYDTKINILNSFSALSDVEKKVIDLLFENEKKPSEVASELGVSEVRVSQIKKKAIEKLRDHLTTFQ